jgi:hypothetical protein
MIQMVYIKNIIYNIFFVFYLIGKIISNSVSDNKETI